MFDCLVIATIAIGALWLLRKIGGWLVGLLVLPAQRQPKGLAIVGEFFVPIKNGKLSTLEMLPELKGGAFHTGQYIVCFCYKDRSYTHPTKMQDIQALANHNRATAVAFDYPNVGNSLGMVSCQKDLVKAGIAQVERLLENGVPAHKITLYGHSLGGAVATKVADYFHKNKECVSLINDRSFSSLGAAVGGWVKGPLIFKKGTSVIVNALCWIFNWDMNVANIYPQIPADYKMHIVSKVDKMVDYQTASLHKKSRTPSKTHKTYAYKIGGQHNGHTKPLHSLVDNKTPCTPINKHITRFMEHRP